MKAKIGKHAAENGNEKARKKFTMDFPDLKESTIRNFKKKYYVKLAEARKAGNTEAFVLHPKFVVAHQYSWTSTTYKLLTFLKGIRSRDGVINVHVVRGVTHALITSNPATTHLNNFDMHRSCVILYEQEQHPDHHRRMVCIQKTVTLSCQALSKQ